MKNKSRTSEFLKKTNNKVLG